MKKPRSSKPKLPPNFNVIGFLKKVLGAKVEESENPNKRLFAKMKSIIMCLESLMQEDDIATLKMPNITENFQNA